GSVRVNFTAPKRYREHYRSAAYIAGRRGRATSRLCAHARSWKTDCGRAAEDLPTALERRFPSGYPLRASLHVLPPFVAVRFSSHDKSLPRTRSASRAIAPGG